MKALPNTRNCFACGSNNASGLRLTFRTDGRQVHAQFDPRPEHCGFTHAVHGGIITTALDEIMAWAVIAIARKAAYSAEFTVRFTRPVRVGNSYLLTGEVTNTRRGRLFETLGELRTPEGELCATATGKYLPLPEADAIRALEDFPPDSGVAELLGLHPGATSAIPASASPSPAATGHDAGGCAG